MSSQTREQIEKYCEKFEKEMLNLFDRCYRKGDPKMMHVCHIFENTIGISSLRDFSALCSNPARI